MTALLYDYTPMTGGIMGDCPWCKTRHPRLKCPLISAVEFTAEGSVRRIEFVEQVVSGKDPPPK